MAARAWQLGVDAMQIRTISFCAVLSRWIYAVSVFPRDRTYPPPATSR